MGSCLSDNNNSQPAAAPAAAAAAAPAASAAPAAAAAAPAAAAPAAAADAAAAAPAAEVKSAAPVTQKAKLYYTPTSCGAVSFITALTNGVHLDTEIVDLATHKTASGADFYAVNPKV